MNIYQVPDYYKEMMGGYKIVEEQVDIALKPIPPLMGEISEEAGHLFYGAT